MQPARLSASPFPIMGIGRLHPGVETIGDAATRAGPMAPRRDACVPIANNANNVCMSRTIAARVEDDLATELDQLALQTGRSKSALIEQALRSYVTSEREFLAKVDAGLADLEAGRLADHTAVAAAIRRMYRPAA